MKQKLYKKVLKLYESKRAFNVYLFVCCILSGIVNALKALWAIKRLKKGKKVLAIMMLIEIPINVAYEIYACVRAVKAQEEILSIDKEIRDEVLNSL